MRLELTTRLGWESSDLQFSAVNRPAGQRHRARSQSFVIQDQKISRGETTGMKRNPVAWAGLIVATAALLNSTGFLRPMPAAPKVTEESQRTAKALSDGFGAVAEFTRPSVVQVSVQKKASALMPNMRRFQRPTPRGNNPNSPNDPSRDLEEMLRRFFTPEGMPQREQFDFRQRGVGSGFVFDNKGHILTNNHVVEDAAEISVIFSDGTEVKATVVGTDKHSDVAVIKVDNSTYPPLPKGDSSKLKVGELVMAIGSPFGFSQSVTTGIISALDRNSVGINDYESFIQTDAPINRGNSGGPLVDMDGNVVGVNSVIVSGSQGNDGIGFAIPINLATSVANMIIKDGKVQYARIGIQLEPLKPFLARSLGLEEGAKGVLVGNIVAGSPAEKAGLKQGDVIVSFAGEKVSDPGAFKLKVATSEVSKPYEVAFIRDGKQQTATVVPAPSEKVIHPSERKLAIEPQESHEAPKTTVEGFGLDVQPLTPELAKPLGLPEDQKGLVVSGVKEGSSAEAEGIKEGDVITKVIRDRKAQVVGSVKDFQDFASKTEDMAIYVHTTGGGRFVHLSKSAK
jgi:serine protease Do